MLGKSLSFLVVTDSDGRVLARGEDRERIGDSLSDDALVRRALNGQEVASVAVKDGVLVPEVSVRAVVPIKQDKEVIGVVLAGTVIDNAFVDGIKAATGLEAAVYGDDVLAATTQVSADGKSRWVGTKNQESGVRSQVLEKGENYSGSQNVLNTPYFVSYMPLKDMDGATLAAAAKSIELTFLTTAILIVVAVGPAYVISRFMANQLS
ncbi:MAG: hypothetical protein UX42_C0011G0003 [Microgenomates group bacterium GW2011_GWC1_46_20]|nr:MAG: hypothetical protein UX42_C0011G0003 [Microgenomates group bacterium GW2011_GWC1_46_20]